jgi:hypothetical protein
MFLQALFICLLANGLLVESTDNVIANVIRPKTLSDEAHNEEIRSFWTDERLKAAKPLNITLPSFSSRTRSSNTNVSIGPQSSVPGSLPLYYGKTSRAISPTGREIYTTGRVFWQVGTSYYSCSASVVGSTSNDLIVTAGHCVYDISTKTWYNNNNWVFIPAYSNNNKPYGTWAGRSFLIKTPYQTSGDYNYDVAFVALSKLNQRHIQAVVGAQGIGFNQPRSAFINSFGYPANLDSGLYLKNCTGYAQPSKYTYNKYVGQGLSCNMGHGLGLSWMLPSGSTGCG